MQCNAKPSKAQQADAQLFIMGRFDPKVFIVKIAPERVRKGPTRFPGGSYMLWLRSDQVCARGEPSRVCLQ